ncbi:MAG: hypothetical protein K2G99_02605, partial [Desulfovibrio sp.]|nr:hypothetical protein [Desulfovibrio sp.]
AASGRPLLRVVISLDVEEEGLFCGTYAATGCGVRNVELLPKLAPLSDELGFPLTLFCAYTVFSSAPARAVLERMRDRHGAEIGAHLHHWSTPPFDPQPGAPAGEPARTHRLPRELLRRRLRALLDAGREFQSAPLTSFRMGRWDLKAEVRPLLAEEGILVDSSVCPLRAFRGGPDHFLAPPDPYWVPGAPGKPLLEAPITQVPLVPGMEGLWHRVAARRPRLLDRFHFFGALSANPFWHGAAAMRLATRLHVRRGGKVLGLFWHSSEMLPGGSPHVPDEASARAALDKIFSFCRWLRAHFAVEGVTLTALRGLAPELGFSRLEDLPHCGGGDW